MLGVLPFAQHLAPCLVHNGVDDVLRASMFILFVDDGDNAMVGLVMMMMRELILRFGESHNNLTGSNAVSREYNISIINFAIINTDIVIKLQYYDLIIWDFFSFNCDV